MDGYLKIKTKIDNKDIDKDITALENKIKKLQINNAQSSQEQDTLTKEIQQYEELTQKADAYRNQIKLLEKEKESMIKSNPNLVVSSTPELNNINIELETIKQKYSSTTEEIDKQASKVEKLHTKLEKIKSKQTENNAKISDYKQTIEQINTNNIQKSLNTVGKNLQNQIGKMGKMAMAVVGIRTAWYAVRGAITAVSEYNDQISTDFEYMRYCIANMLAPAVEKLTQLLYTLLSYVNAIANAWFGINLFGNSSAKNFKKMKENATGTAKATKEIAKTLTGFDEMNVVSDSSSSGSGGSTGVSTPSMDLSGIQGDVPAWLQWIINNKDLILGILGGITAGVMGLKLGLGGIKSLGIGMMVTGVILLIQDLIKYLNDPSWENFGKIISDIGLIIVGFGVLIGNVPVIVAGAIAIIVGLVISNWEKIKEFLQNGIDWLNGQVDWVKENFGIFGQVIYQTFTAILQELLNMFDGIFNGVKEIFDGILKVFKGIFTGDMKTVLEGFKQIFKGVFDSLWSIAKVPLNLIIRGINSLIRGANKIKFDVPDWVPGFGGKTFGFNIKEIPLLAKGAVLTKPTPVIAGEAGAEAIMPLENNLEWLDVLADKLASRMGSSSGSTNVYLDGRLIQRQITKRKEQLDFATNR